MAQPHVFLTLDLPEKGLSGEPIVASYNITLLRLFKKFVLMDWEDKLCNAPTDDVVVLARAELERLKAVLDIFIPANVEGARANPQ